MDKLELKDIAPYYAYNLLFMSKYNTIHKLGIHNEIRGKGIESRTIYQCLEMKPILRPMSDLTKEITHNGEAFVPIERLKEYSDHKIEFEDPDYILIKEDYSFEQNVLGAPLVVIQKLCEWHIDFQDLIGRGLAINLNEVDNGK